MTGELKILDRQIKREYTKHGKSQKFLLMKGSFKNLYKKESTRFLYKNVNLLMTTKPGRANKILKSMGTRIGEDTDSTNFNLPQFQESNMTPYEIANQIANHFASIYQEFKPVELGKLPPDVRDSIVNRKLEEIGSNS